MRDAFIETLTELAAEDPRVAVVTGDLGYGVITAFAQRFPNHFNAGVAEQNMTASPPEWRSPEGGYTYSIANFPTLRCLEQVRNDICYHVQRHDGRHRRRLSYGNLGMSHLATEDIAVMRALPNMRVVAPTEKWEAQDLVRDLAAQKAPLIFASTRIMAALRGATASGRGSARRGACARAPTRRSSRRAQSCARR